MGCLRETAFTDTHKLLDVGRAVLTAKATCNFEACVHGGIGVHRNP